VSFHWAISWIKHEGICKRDERASSLVPSL